MSFIIAMIVATSPILEHITHVDEQTIQAQKERNKLNEQLRALSTAELIARVNNDLAQSKLTLELSVKIIAFAELEDAETDPVKKIAARTERRKLYVEYRKLRGLPPKD